VVAAHAQLGQVNRRQAVGPGGLEIAEQEDQLRLDRRDELRDRPVRRLVGEREDQQGANPS
jgi:hypothetical protein